MFKRHFTSSNLAICAIAPVLIFFAVLFSGEGADLRAALGAFFGSLWDLASPVLVPVLWALIILVNYALMFAASFASGRVAYRNAKRHGEVHDLRTGVVYGLITFATIFLMPASMYWSLCVLVLSLFFENRNDDEHEKEDDRGVGVVLSIGLLLLGILVSLGTLAGEFKSKEDLIRYTPNMSVSELEAADAAYEDVMDDMPFTWRQEIKSILSSQFVNSTMKVGDTVYTCSPSGDGVKITRERYGEVETLDNSEINPAVQRTCLSSLGLLPE